MEISFIQMQMLVHLHVNKTNFHVKGFTVGLALKQAKGNLEIAYCQFGHVPFDLMGFICLAKEPLIYVN